MRADPQEGQREGVDEAKISMAAINGAELLRRGSDLVLPSILFNPPGSIDQLLFTRVEGMTYVADFDTQLLDC